jgi:hypothetical protein
VDAELGAPTQMAVYTLAAALPDTGAPGREEGAQSR